MHGHPNQSGHITSSTAKWELDTNSEGQDKHNLSFNTLSFTTTVVDQWSESYLSSHKRFSLLKSSKWNLMMKIILFKTSFTSEPYKSNV